MVKIYKGFEARESALLKTATETIRQEREASWSLPEDDYYVAVFWNGDTERPSGSHVAVLAGNSFAAKVSRYGSVSFRRQ
jgi:hypothetical protein